MNNTIIPEIDLAPLWHGGQQGLEQVSEQFKKAYTTMGFAYLLNHEVPLDATAAAFKAAHDFHHLPLESKMAIKQNDCFRGYVPINASQLKVSTEGAAKKPNQLDAFIMAFEVDKHHHDYKEGLYLAGDNQWPTGLSNFKSDMLTYRDHLLILAQKLVSVVSVALGMPKDALDEFFKDPTYFLRLQHYPQQDTPIEDNLFGIAPHTDYGFFTLLAQGDIPGLEVKHPDGQWVVVPCRPNTLVLNSGDMLRRWSNDTVRSTPHRVINQSNTERYSIPFFFEPNMHAQIRVLPSCISQDNPAKHPEVMYGDYLMDRIQGNYGLGKRSTKE